MIFYYQWRMSFITPSTRHAFWVSLYFAVGTGLIAVAWFLFGISSFYPMSGPLRLVAAMVLMMLLVAMLFRLPLPGFRLHLFDVQTAVRRTDSKALLIIFAGLVWRFVVSLPIAAIVFGLGGALGVSLLQRHVTINSGLIDAIGLAFLGFFVGNMVLFFPIAFWWLRSKWIVAIGIVRVVS